MKLDYTTVYEFLKILHFDPKFEIKKNDLGNTVKGGLAFTMFDGSVPNALETVPEDQQDELIDRFHDEVDGLFEEFIEPIILRAYGGNMDENFMFNINKEIEQSIAQLGEPEDYLARAIIESRE